ncbi:uncharacterized protein LOC115231724 [Octopus sinensis]|uniref:Uncharacterized protein LOC115231724 n=1 Tax=Octopus sinensis TaxID=2607531 RepID=A0A6P7U9A3_9MOLL|nr:uncharacterized protein LOC115231724 [Octopus sinensis]
MLESCSQRTPEIMSLAHLAYGSENSLVFDKHIVRSRTGVQQGDPLGPLLFALSIDEVARNVKTPLNLWYLDDATIGGPVDVVLDELYKIVSALAKMGLIINTKKTEIINISVPIQDFGLVMEKISEILPDTKQTRLNDVYFLGCPFGESEVQNHLRAKSVEMSRFTERLSLLDSHTAFFLLKNCIHVPKLLYLLRCSPCFIQDEILHSIDDTLRLCAEWILNVRFDNDGWTQCKLPLNSGGAGLRSALDLALPAFLSSHSSCRRLSLEILHKSPESSLDRPFEDGCMLWKESGLKFPIQTSLQQSWDKLRCEFTADNLAMRLDQHRLACLRSAAVPHSGSWLNAMPIAGLGTLLEDDCMRIGTALRLGLDICEQHRCRCGKMVDVKGVHPLSCKRSAGRAPRHSAINNVILRALESVGFPSILEPVGLDRGDGKRPDYVKIQSRINVIL